MCSRARRRFAPCCTTHLLSGGLLATPPHRVADPRPRPPGRGRRFHQVGLRQLGVGRRSARRAFGAPPLARSGSRFAIRLEALHRPGARLGVRPGCLQQRRDASGMASAAAHRLPWGCFVAGTPVQTEASSSRSRRSVPATWCGRGTVAAGSFVRYSVPVAATRLGLGRYGAVHRTLPAARSRASG